MKGVSIAFTILLFVFAVRLAVHLQRAGILPEPKQPGMEAVAGVPELDNSLVSAHILQAPPYLN